MVLRAVYLAIGDVTIPDNPFHFSQVHLNLLGMVSWNPSMPRVPKLRPDGKLAAEAPIFADDGLTIGPDFWTSRKAISDIAAGVQALGS